MRYVHVVVNEDSMEEIFFTNKQKALSFIRENYPNSFVSMDKRDYKEYCDSKTNEPTCHYYRKELF